MASFEFTPSPILPSASTIRRSSIELPRSILKQSSTTNFIRKLSLTATTSLLPTTPSTPKKKSKTVSFTSTTTTPPITKATRPHHSLPYHFQTAYAFTSKDTKTILIPSTLFALTTATATATSSSTHHQTTTPLLSTLITRLPLILLWTYTSLLPFCISNQNTPASISEDTLNRPSRPLPSKRITPALAKTWMQVSYAFALIFSLAIGSGFTAAVVLILLGWLYNQCHGSENILARNVLTGLGYSAFSAGALDVATAGQGMDARTWGWIGLLALVVMCTGHMTDLPDLEGDKARGRRTIPVVCGAECARWMLAVPIAGASLLCPWFWDARLSGFLVVAGVGGKIVMRLVKGEGDKGTYKMWCGWVAVLYFVPLFQQVAV